ncbi:MAG TPA: efflux RND transporter periplasmic adaptor subunit [Gammaproteobacteria bacterium]|nr:efflux RND transporter periplasmic adaptor subunit [Gammaproteobacteria bacterium]
MKRSFWIAIVLGLTVLGWVLSGQLSPQQQAKPTTNNTVTAAVTPPATKVEVKTFKAIDMTRTLAFQGQIVPLRRVHLRAETAGSVARLMIAKGQTVKAGQALLQLDMADRQARRDQAIAELQLRTTRLQADRKLYKRALLSDNQIKSDRAQLASARADLQRIDKEIERTVIRAPFNGVIEQRNVELGDYLRVGDKIFTLIDRSQLKLAFDVPQQQIGELHTGLAVQGKLIGGGSVTGKVSFIAVSADAASRSFAVEALVSPDDAATNANPPLGQSATATITLGTTRAHHLSPALFNLATDGSLFVKAIDVRNRVLALPVQLLQSDNKGFWVTGLPETVNLVVTGQGFVSRGDVVAPTFVSADTKTTQ